jgi:hypothetical protein
MKKDEDENRGKISAENLNSNVSFSMDYTKYQPFIEEIVSPTINYIVEV